MNETSQDLEKVSRYLWLRGQRIQWDKCLKMEFYWEN